MQESLLILCIFLILNGCVHTPVTTSEKQAEGIKLDILINKMNEKQRNITSFYR